jgi:predicted DNA-binding protein with PD1-like motif
MEYTSGQIGRVFAARLGDGEDVYACIHEIALREAVDSALVLLLGGARRGRVVVGPKRTEGPVRPMRRQFDDAREIVGVGTLHPSDGEPSLHLHAAIGRGDEVTVGCPREGLDCFLVLEVFLIEVRGLQAERVADPASGLKLLALAAATRVDRA